MAPTSSDALLTDTALDDLVFTNRFTTQLPADPSVAVHPRQVAGAAFSRVAPTPVSAPTTIAISAEVLDLLGLPAEVATTSEFAEVFSGNRPLAAMDPYAMVYGGHQFGNWAGQLGDGRAIALGEVLTAAGEHWTLQLKGSGPTPYSRGADGRAVLRSSVREFLCSEAMFHLGVPTTRALSLVLTGDAVVRDMFYDGNPEPELGAVVTRVAPTFVRFGSFQLPASRGDIDLLRTLVDHTIASDFAHLLDNGVAPTSETYVAFFEEVLSRTAALMVHWQRVGFVHGVMNTDNLSIAGLTIDYGPYGWLENYDPDWTPNTTDAGTRRYRYGQQPQVAHWNLLQLANALVPLLDDPAPLQDSINSYPQLYMAGWRSMMAAKLGLAAFDTDAGDEALVEELEAILQLVETDMTIFYRRLADLDAATPDACLLADSYYQPEQLDDAYRQRLAAWLDRYGARLRSDGTDPAKRRSAMNAVNPKYVLRNWLAQVAIDRSTDGDHSGIAELLDVLRHPYDEQPDHEAYAAKRPEWARSRPGCSMLSCSS